MPRKPRNKNALIADREKQRTYRTRVENERFGIYRPLTPNSREDVERVLPDIQREVHGYLNKRRLYSAKLEPLDDFGVTFVQRLGVARSMRLGMLQRGFEMARMLDELYDYTGSDDRKLEVPLDETETFAWYSRSSRKLVAQLAVGDAFDRLREEAGVFREILDEVGGESIHVYQPSHVTFMRYGKSRDGLSLSAEQQRVVTRIAERNFADAGITSLTLGRVVVGDSYSG